MNLPNKLTILRIILVPVYLLLLWISSGNPLLSVAALIVFIVAALTDLIDGQIARKHNMVTNFGKFMDPIADKLLVICPLIIMVGMGRFPAWMCAVIVARELAVSGFRLVAALANRVIAADKLGKYKTTFQIGCVIALMLIVNRPWSYIGDVFVWTTVILTAWSGIECIWKNKDLLSDM